MKIVTNSQLKDIGGIGRVLSSLSHHLMRERSDIELVPLVVSTEKGNVESFFWTSTLVHGRPGWVMNTPTQYAQKAYAQSNTLDDLTIAMRALIRAYRSRLELEKPDLILLNGSYYRPWALMRAAREVGVPMVMHYHGSVFIESIGTIMENLAKEMEADFSKGISGYIFPSRIASKKASENMFTGDARVCIIPNGIREEFFEVNGAHDPRAVGCVLRWEPVKNTEFLERFFEYNSQQQDPFRITVISDLDEGQKKMIQREHLIFGHSRPPVELARFYADQGAILCPSLFETFGNVPAESVASGTPAFISPTTGVSEVFRSVGLKRLVLDFTSPETSYREVGLRLQEGITKKERTRLQEELNENRINALILQALFP